jgi:hypothetical protein
MTSFSTEPKDIRKFGLIGVLFFGLLAGLALWRQKMLPGYTFGILSFLFTGFCLFPTALTPAYRGWMRIAHVIGTGVTAVILTLTYYLVITPFGLGKRIFGGRPLPLKPDSDRLSYWVSRTEKIQPKYRFRKRY